jgi:hypothetical protein
VGQGGHERGGERREPGTERGRDRPGTSLGPERQVGQGQQLTRHRPALAVVGVEQRPVTGPGRRERELPAEVGGVLDGRVHPLAGGRGEGVRRVPGQEQPAPPEPAGHPALHHDPRGPLQVGDPRVQAGLVDQGLQVDGRNRRAERPWFQPPRRRGAGREQPPGRPLTEAEGEQQPASPGHDAGGVAGQITVELGVGQHHLHRVNAAGPAQLGLGPHRADRAVAAGGETEPGLLRSGWCAQGGPDTAGFVAHRGQLGAALHLDPAASQRSGQHPLHVHLPDQRQVREGGVRQREAAELDVDHAGAEPQVGRWRGVGPGQQRLRHPERAQHLQRAGVQDERARRPDRVRPPVDDPDRGAVGVRLQGQGQPGRARARHQDVRRQPTPVSRHQAASPPSRCGRSSTSSRRSPGSTM